jgi:hypothetical protein
LLWSSSPVASLLYLALFHSDLASAGPVDAALVSLPALCWRPWPHCTGVITNLTLSLLPPLRQHHCLCCVSAFAPVVLALLPLSPLHCRQHSKLASAQSQNSCNMRWHHCQHRAIDVAGVAPALFPLLRRCLCPCCAGVATLSAPALPPASQTGICPVMTQSQHVLGEASLSCSTSLPVASLLYPALAHSNFGLWQSGKGSDCVFLVLHWCPLSHCAGIIASIKLFLLPVLHQRCCQVGLQRSGRCRAGVCRSCVCVLPASRWHHCQHCAVAHVAGIVPASLPLSHGCFCPCRAGIFACSWASKKSAVLPPGPVSP